jgi:IMP dehydrogenase
MNKYLTFDDVLIKPNYCGFESRKNVNTGVDLNEDEHLSIPFISSPMDTISGPEMVFTMFELGGFGILHRFCTIEENVELYKETLGLLIDKYGSAPDHWLNKLKQRIGVSVGVNEGLDRAIALYNEGARIFCVDVAHGHSKACGNMVKALKEAFNDITVIAGSVCTAMGGDYLIGCGADIIRVGVGCGSACSTRIKTGIGVPQLSAIMECSKLSKPIIADGGIRTPGDAVKALAAGASFVMLGGMLAATWETPGEVNYISNTGYNAIHFLNDAENVIADSLSKRHIKIGTNSSSYFAHKQYRGMASKEAFEDTYGELPEWKTAEGVAVTLKVKGSVKQVIHDLVGGLRSGLTYCGSEDIKQLQSRAEFIQVTNAGIAESHPHILKENQ